MLALYVIALLALGWLGYRLILDPLSHVPGPLISRFIPIYYIQMIRKGKHIFTSRELHNTYGPVVRMGPSDLSFATTSAFDSIYGIAADQTFTIRGSRRSLLVPSDMVNVMLSNCISKESRNWLRPMIAVTLKELTGVYSERLFNVAFEEGLKLHRVGQTVSTSIDLSTLNSDYLWDLGSLIAFGKHDKRLSRLNFDVQLNDAERFMCFLEICLCFFDRSIVQQYRTAFYKVWQLLSKLAGMPSVPFINGEQDTIRFKDNQYARLKTVAKKDANKEVADTCLQINSYSTKLSIYGSTHSSINAVFYYLLKNPQCLKKVEDELLPTFQSYSEISDDRLATLPYLNACIQETLRLTPPFSPGILQRVSKGATVDGIYVPAGVGVSVDQYTLGNSGEHWEAPDSFLPERWLDSNSRKNEKASRPFLIGNRQCLGRNMALQLYRLAIGKTVYLYQMELMNKDFDITLHSFSCLAWTNVDLEVTMKPRVPGVLGYE